MTALCLYNLHLPSCSYDITSSSCKSLSVVSCLLQLISCLLLVTSLCAEMLVDAELNV
jgi:hypothetical protein